MSSPFLYSISDSSLGHKFQHMLGIYCWVLWLGLLYFIASKANFILWMTKKVNILPIQVSEILKHERMHPRIGVVLLKKILLSVVLGLWQNCVDLHIVTKAIACYFWQGPIWDTILRTAISARKVGKAVSLDWYIFFSNTMD